MTLADDPTAEVTDLLQRLIRNACVNEGLPSSGGEMRSVDLLASYLTAPGVELRRYEPLPGRGSLVLRVEGSDRSAPSLHLMGHLDVVPVSPSGWRHDPFGGELIDGEIWGRGAVDMLNTTASMAVAVRRLLDRGFRPKGTLVYSAMADEEALGTYGAHWLTEHAWDDVRADYVLTEFGGFGLPIGSGAKLPVMVAEKGSHWTRLRLRGTPGHGSMPYGSDNAVVKAAEAVRRIAAYRPPARLGELWTRFVAALSLPPELSARLNRPDEGDGVWAQLPAGVARMLYACTHTTFAPTVLHGGVKTNIIPDRAEIDIDIRTMPGEDRTERVRAMLAEALGDLWPEVEVVAEGDNLASESPADTPLFDTLTRITAALRPGATTVPFTIVGATDARFFRRKGVTAYGYGLFGERIPFTEFTSMFHGNDERVDQESLRLSVALWEWTAREFCGA
ncbi:MAG: M20/M25/M40 family metallo-hydrolase [Candidatus Limnocylindria bacterium]